MVANMAKKLRKSTSSGTPMVAQKSLGTTIGHGAEPGKEPYEIKGEIKDGSHRIWT